jgi:hypothetical protein
MDPNVEVTFGYGVGHLPAKQSDFDAIRADWNARETDEDLLRTLRPVDESDLAVHTHDAVSNGMLGANGNDYIVARQPLRHTFAVPCAWDHTCRADADVRRNANAEARNGLQFLLADNGRRLDSEGGYASRYAGHRRDPRRTGIGGHTAAYKQDVRVAGTDSPSSHLRREPPLTDPEEPSRAGSEDTLIGQEPIRGVHPVAL